MFDVAIYLYTGRLADETSQELHAVNLQRQCIPACDSDEISPPPHRPGDVTCDLPLLLELDFLTIKKSIFLRKRCKKVKNETKAGVQWSFLKRAAAESKGNASIISLSHTQRAHHPSPPR
jgi:hypothetical protein